MPVHRCRQGGPVLRVGDVTGDGGHPGHAGEGRLQQRLPAGVDDERPAAVVQLVSEGAAEAAGRAGDDGEWHDVLLAFRCLFGSSFKLKSTSSQEAIVRTTDLLTVSEVMLRFDAKPR